MSSDEADKELIQGLNTIIRMAAKVRGKPEQAEHAIKLIDRVFTKQREKKETVGQIATRALDDLANKQTKGVFLAPVEVIDRLSDEELVQFLSDTKCIATNMDKLSDLVGMAMAERLINGKTLKQVEEESSTAPLGKLVSLLEKLLEKQKQGESSADQAVRESQKNTSRFDWDGLGFK